MGLKKIIVTGWKKTLINWFELLTKQHLSLGILLIYKMINKVMESKLTDMKNIRIDVQVKIKQCFVCYIRE